MWPLVGQQQVQRVRARREVQHRLHLALAKVDVLVGERQRLLEVQRQRLVDQQVVVAGASGGLAGRHQAAHRQPEPHHERRFELCAVDQVGERCIGLAAGRGHHPRVARQVGLGGLLGGSGPERQQGEQEKSGGTGGERHGHLSCTHSLVKRMSQGYAALRRNSRNSPEPRPPLPGAPAQNGPMATH
jgi:hypothetical protein